MDLFTRENGVTVGFGVVALAAFYALGSVAGVPDVARWAVLIAVGVVVPTAVNAWLTPRRRGS